MHADAIYKVFLHPSPLVLLVVLSLIIVVHFTIERLPNKRDTPVKAFLNRSFNQLYAIYSAMCLVLCCYFMLKEIKLSSFPVILFCGEIHAKNLSIMTVTYFWSKLWEGLIDLSLVTMRGFPINLHFRLHHYTTPLFAWLGLVSASAHAQTFMMLNLFMHTLVYAFHGGCRHEFLFKMIRRFQYVQLFGGTLVCVAAFAMRMMGSPCTSTTGPVGIASDIVPAVLFMMYYRLFLIEIQEYERTKKSS